MVDDIRRGERVDLEAAVTALCEGRCIGVETDTVFGLAAMLSSEAAVSQLFDMKGRADTKAIAVLVSSVEMASQIGVLDGLASRLAAKFWPGALTLVVPRQPDCRADLGGDPTTIGLRWPAFAELEGLIGHVGPIATTSANRTGEPPLATVKELREVFGEQVATVFSPSEFSPSRGTAAGTGQGVASTVVAVHDGEWTILREGGISRAQIEATCELLT
ncbi:MAG TPA: threonylcarbamoyl-AMP synthase [Acidimicrobiaceae bacterium]|nr:threonylcarbamoyl-AMP synthase [Acidimicrobiaceae bacterium]